MESVFFKCEEKTLKELKHRHGQHGCHKENRFQTEKDGSGKPVVSGSQLAFSSGGKSPWPGLGWQQRRGRQVDRYMFRKQSQQDLLTDGMGGESRRQRPDFCLEKLCRRWGTLLKWENWERGSQCQMSTARLKVPQISQRKQLARNRSVGFWNEVNADNTDWGVTGGLNLKSGAAGSNELIPRPRFLIR